jgi:hypothetical protein
MRFRLFVTWAFRPLSIVAPIALVVAAGVTSPTPWLGQVLIIAIVLLAALLTLVRMWDLRWARTGCRLFTRREAWTVTLLAFLLGWWIMGVGMIAVGESYGSLAFVNGMFGVLVTTGILFRWAARKPSTA